MAEEAKQFVAKIRELRAGTRGMEDIEIPAAFEQRILELSEKEVGILEGLYESISESPVFGANRYATMILCIQVVGKLNPEMVKSALSELNYMNSATQTEPNFKLDGARQFYKRGQAAFKNEEFPRAKNYFARAVQIAPEFREGWFALAGTCELLGISDEAAQAFEQAQRLTK